MSAAILDLDTLPGTRFEVPSWMSPEEAASKYGTTPDWPLERILTLEGEDRARAEGRSWHVGGGLWVAVCPSCDAYTLTHGSLPIYNGIGLHMVKAHPGARVPGINVGIMA